MKSFYEEGLITKKVMEYHAKAFKEMNRKEEESIKLVFFANKLNICLVCKKPYPASTQ